MKIIFTILGLVMCGMALVISNPSRNDFVSTLLSRLENRNNNEPNLHSTTDQRFNDEIEKIEKHTHEQQTSDVKMILGSQATKYSDFLIISKLTVNLPGRMIKCIGAVMNVFCLRS